MSTTDKNTQPKQVPARRGLWPKYLAVALVWAITLAFQAFLVLHGKPLSGWIGAGGFALGGILLGWL